MVYTLYLTSLQADKGIILRGHFLWLFLFRIIDYNLALNAAILFKVCDGALVLTKNQKNVRHLPISRVLAGLF